MINGQRSVLQRRSNLSNTFQSFLDSTIVVGFSWFLIDKHVGMITAEHVVFVLLLLGMLALVYDHFGIYRANASFTRKALRLLQAWTISFGTMLILLYLMERQEMFPLAVLYKLYAAGYLVQLGTHYVIRRVQERYLRNSVQRAPTIIIGDGKLATYLYQKISQNPWLGEDVIGCVTLKSTRPQQTVLEASHPPILGELSELLTLIDSHEVRTVYFVTPLDASEIIEELYFKLLDRNVAVHWIPDIFSLRLINHSVREIAGLPVLILSETPLTGTRLFLKSLEDRVLASLLVLMLSPVLLCVALAVKFDSPGPIFFRQPRNGWNGKTFKIWKFRSMYLHPVEAGKVKQAEKDDPRITPVGRFIRRTSLDELPQLFNVLTGEMSLVGPRPHAVQHDEEYSQRIGDYFARHNIKPGITGLAQVRGLRGETRDIQQMIERVEADIEYINNWSVWLDLSILIRTTTAFTGKNAY